MNELLLNCNISGLFLTMGLPTLDPVMTSVLDYIHQHALFLGSWGGFAKSLGLILAMCVTSYECWMMMLGRRGIDVMKLLRIVGISLCIVSANAIADAVAAPGESMGRVMKAQAIASHKRIDTLEKHEAKLQSQYLDKLRAHNDSLDRKRRAEAKLSEDSHWWEEVAYAVKNMDNAVEEWAKEAAVIAETKTAEMVNMLIRYIGEIIYDQQVCKPVAVGTLDIYVQYLCRHDPEIHDPAGHHRLHHTVGQCQLHVGRDRRSGYAGNRKHLHVCRWPAGRCHAPEVRP